MGTPLIGITMYARGEENDFRLQATYIDAVRRAGGIPVLLPPGESRIEQLVTRIDGLILAGGGDIEPVLYGGTAHEMIYGVDKERDRTEISYVRGAIAAQLPLLGVCRGCQLVNVALGGSLIEHLPDEFGNEIPHRLPPREPTNHTIRLEAGSRLARILQVTQLDAVSWHHQAVRRPAETVQVVGTSLDGCIEAIESVEHPWLIAVQWHPELSHIDDAVQQRLFRDLVETARQRQRNANSNLPER